MAANPNEPAQEQPPANMSEDQAVEWYKRRLMAHLKRLPPVEQSLRRAALVTVQEVVKNEHLSLLARPVMGLGFIEIGRREKIYQRLKLRHGPR